MTERTNYEQNEVLKFTQEQLSKFYLQAFKDGAEARNISGMCANIEQRHVTIERMASALIEAFSESED